MSKKSEKQDKPMTYQEMEKRLAELEAAETKRNEKRIDTEIFNDPKQNRFTGTLSGGRLIVMKRLSVPQMDSIQVEVAEAYKDNAQRAQIEAGKEQHLAALVQVGSKVRGGEITADELWADLGRNRSQCMQMWTLIHDTTEDEDRDFFGTIRTVVATPSLGGGAE